MLWFPRNVPTLSFVFPFHSQKLTALQVQPIKFNTANIYWEATAESQAHLFCGIILNPFPVLPLILILLTTQSICEVAYSSYSLLFSVNFWNSLQCTLCQTVQELVLNPDRGWKLEDYRPVNSRLVLAPCAPDLWHQVSHAIFISVATYKMQERKRGQHLFSSCYGLNLSLQNPYVEILMSNVMVLQGGAFGWTPLEQDQYP